MPFKTLEPNHTQRQSHWAWRRSLDLPSGFAGLADLKPSSPSLTVPLHGHQKRHRRPVCAVGLLQLSLIQPEQPTPGKTGPAVGVFQHLPRPNLRVSPFELPLATNPLHHVQDCCAGRSLSQHIGVRLPAPPIRDLLPAFPSGCRISDIRCRTSTMTCNSLQRR